MTPSVCQGAEGKFADGTRIVVEHQPGGTREILLYLDAKRISRTVIVPMLMRIGAAVVRMDGIGGVSTEEGYRNQGYSRRVMEASLTRMRAGDAALSTLFGIQDFYQKFGYETAGPDYLVGVPIEAASVASRSLPSGWRMRRLTAADVPAVMQLYHRNTRWADGALVRHDAADDSPEAQRLAEGNPDARKIGLRAWNRLRKIAVQPGNDECRVLLDEAGSIAAYAWFGANWWMDARRRDFPDAFHLAEAMARDAAAADALLAACRTWASEAGSRYESISLAIPPEGPVAWAAAYEGGQMLSTFTRGGDFMGRVLDIGRLIEQLLPELSARVRQTSLRFDGQLTLATEMGEATLSITPEGASTRQCAGGARLTAALPQATLARLCLGGFDTGDVVARLPEHPNPEAAALLGILFPRRHPHIYPMDRF